MKISLDWLSDYIDIKQNDIQTIKEKVTECIAEVEGVERQGALLENMVVGKVMELKKHPNADKLKIAMTDVGAETVQIVCGGSNLKEGMLVAVAKPGAQVRWHGEGDLVMLEKTKIRGEESIGMICASNEIGLDELFPLKGEFEITDLSHLDIKVGEDLAKALGMDDKVLDIDNHAITHRADLFSHKGIAREFVAANLASMREEKKVGEGIVVPDDDLPIDISFEDPEIASRYCAVTLKNVKVQESPDYIKKRLQACGIRPINNIVDITNYIMLEYGTPCHAFDLNTIHGKKVVHRKTKKGEKITTLDGVERELPENAIIIEDEKKIFDLAGIMGGENSQILEKTNEIWLHVGIYNKVLIRRASIAIGHRTDASTIFEKGVPFYFAYEAVLRALELLKESCPDMEVASRILDVKNYHDEERIIDLHKESIERLAGVSFDDEEIMNTLTTLGFEVVSHPEGHFGVKVPEYRYGDIHAEEDLVEEIVRIHGFNTIEAVVPMGEVQVGHLPESVRISRLIKSSLVSMGFHEVYTYSFLGEDLLKKVDEQVDETYLKIENYITEDISIMRQSLLPRLLETVQNNLRYQEGVKIFELSKVYFYKDNQVEENRILTGVVCGDDYEFLSLKGVVEFLMNKMGLQEKYKSIEKDLFPFVHPGNNTEVFVHGKSIGVIAQLHPHIQKNFEIDKKVFVFELDFELLCEIGKKLVTYKPLLRFPTITLDISILIPEKDLAEKYLKIIQKTDKGLLHEAKIIDEYRGKQVEQGKRSVTYSLVYAALDRTLKESEAQEIHSKIVQALEKEGAVLRS